MESNVGYFVMKSSFDQRRFTDYIWVKLSFEGFHEHGCL